MQKDIGVQQTPPKIVHARSIYGSLEKSSLPIDLISNRWLVKKDTMTAKYSNVDLLVDTSQAAGSHFQNNDDSSQASLYA